MNLDKYSRNMMLTSEKFSEERTYWLQKLNALEMSRLPADVRGSWKQQYRKGTLHLTLPDHLCKCLFAIGNSEVARFMIGVTGVKLLVHKYTGFEDLSIGMPPFSSEQKGEAGLETLFALRTVLDKQGTARDFLLAVRNTISEARKYRNLSFTMMRELLSLELHDETNLFPCLVYSEQLHSKPDAEKLRADHCLAFQFDAESISITWEYNAALYEEETLKRMASHLTQILQQLVEQPDRQVRDLDMLTDEEKASLLATCIQDEAEVSEDRTVVELFAEQVRRTPDAVAVQDAKQTLSYLEVDAKSNQLAHILRSRGVKAESIVAVMMERSAEMMITLLAVLKAGGAYLPIHPAFPEERINFLLKDSGAALLLTCDRLLDVSFAGEHIDLVDIELSTGESSDVERVHTADNLAYVMYTSGTTGLPKGTMIEHRALLHRLNWMQQQYPLGVGDAILQKTPFTFDVSLLELFGWCGTGAKICFLEQDAEKDPALTLEAIERYGITTIHFVPSLLQAFLTYLESGIEAGHRLASVRDVFACGEALRPQTVDAFYRMFSGGNGRLINLYGPTEATILVSHYECPQQQSGIVPIGRAIDQVQMYVLDDGQRLQPVGVVGELYLAGVGLARGYLHLPELTDEKFVPHPFLPGARIYKTGDLARWLPDGSLEFLGRTDHQVKIRGYRIELGEIENQVRQCSGSQDAVVLAQELQGNTALVGYLVDRSGLDLSDLQKRLGAMLPDYMVPSYFVLLEEMPLLANGKLDRKALPLPKIHTEEEYVAPRDPEEAGLVEIWQEVLGVQPVGIQHNFFKLGGDSLKAILLISKIHQSMQVRVPLGEVFRLQIIRDLADYVRHAQKSIYQALERAAVQEYYPASSAQKRLFILEKFGEVHTAYNMSMAVLIERDDLEIIGLEQVLNRLIERHESLRTSFHLIDDQVMQKIHPTASVELDVVDCAESEVEERYLQFVRRFDLQEAPLMRAMVLRIGPARHLLLIDMPHIISDGVSLEILMGEFQTLLAGGTLPSLPFQYKDFSQWQNQLMQNGLLQGQYEYWLNRLAGDLPVLRLPLDFPRPALQSFEGDKIIASLSQDLSAALRNVATSTGSTLFMVLLTAYYALLAKYTGQDDLIVGTPIAGRAHADLQNIVGKFVNTLALRSQPRLDKTFREYLAEVKDGVIEAFENQECQFEELVDLLNIPRDLSRNPLFDTMFLLQNTPSASAPHLEGLQIYEQVAHKTAKFDLQMEVREAGEQLHVHLEYSTKLFKRETVEGMLGHFLNILQEVAHRGIDLSLEELDQAHAAEYPVVTDGTEQTQEELLAQLRRYLAEELPEYMVPPYLVVIDQIPLTANGKLDRSALPEPDWNAGKAHGDEPPSNELERVLSLQFAEVLGVEQVGVQDDFFQLGGNSIKIITMVAKVYEQFGVDVPPIEVARTPTVRQVATLVQQMLDEEEAAAIQGHPMILLNEQRPQHLFAFPGIGGYAVIYARLAVLLDQVSFHGFDFIEDEERVEHYVRLILEVQPEGPYVLFGYSAGGNLAYEVALELNRLGHVVSDMILLDTTRQYKREDLPLTQEQQEEVRDVVVEFLNEHGDIRDLIGDQERLVMNAVRKVQRFARYLSVVEHSHPLDARIHQIKAEDGTEQDWQSLSTQPVLRYQGFGPHKIMVTEPDYTEANARIVAGILQDINRS